MESEPERRGTADGWWLQCARTRMRQVHVRVVPQPESRLHCDHKGERPGSILVLCMRQAARPGRVVDRSGWRGEAGAQDMVDSQCSGCGIGLHARSFPAWGRSHRRKDLRVPALLRGAVRKMVQRRACRCTRLCAPVTYLLFPRSVPVALSPAACFGWCVLCVGAFCVCVRVFSPSRARARALSLSRARSLSLGTFCGARRNHVSAGGHDHLQQGRRLHRGRRPWLQDPGRG